MKLNKSTVTCISIAVGSVMLAIAAFANFVTANGYNIYKSALKGLFQERNYTMTVTAWAEFDGEMFDDKETYYEEIDLDTGVYTKTITTAQTGEEFISEKGTIASVGDYISKKNYVVTYGERAISEPIASVNDVYYNKVSGTLSYDFDEDSIETFEKTAHFIETAADLCVGDLKNNFVYLQDTDVGHEYQLTVDSFQIPEIINAGLALIGSQYKSSAEAAYSSSASTDNPLYSIYDDLRGKSLSCRAVVDNYGRLRENDIIVELTGSDAGGTEHTLSIMCTIRIDKYDETVPQEIDLSDCVEITYQSDEFRNRIAGIQQDMANTGEGMQQFYQDQIDSLQKALDNMDNKVENAKNESAESAAIIGGADTETAIYIE